MKRAIIIIFLGIMISTTIYAQNQSEQLKKITSSCQKIRKEGFSRTDTIFFDCSDRNDYGMIRYFFKGNDMRYVEWEGSDSVHSQYFNLYYLVDGQLIYCHTLYEELTIDFGDSDSTGGFKTRENHHERISYANGGDGIYCLEKSFSYLSDSVDQGNPDDYNFEEASCAFYNEFIYSDFRDLLSLYAKKKKLTDCPFDLLPPK